jgi:hypothetical protein
MLHYFFLLLLIRLIFVLRPCVGELGNDPVEVEMFDFDPSTNKMNVTLLPNEILYLPFTFMTLLPTIPIQRKLFTRHSAKLRNNNEDDYDKDGGYKNESKEEVSSVDDVQRTLEVKIVSGSHGHLVAVLRAHVHPRPFIINRALRFHEYENSIAKRKIRLVGINDSNFQLFYPGNYLTEMKYVHCVENTFESNQPSQSNLKDQIEGTNSRVVIEWGSRLEESSTVHQDDHVHSLDLFIRYRCLNSSSNGMFYLLIYNDPYQCELHEV